VAFGRRAELQGEVLLSGSQGGSDLVDMRAPGWHFQLVWHPDHVVWVRSGSVRRWLLPDQDDVAGTPRLTAVVRAQVSSKGANPVHVLLAGDDGAVLARIAHGEPRALDLVWPDSAFASLTAHGVVLTSAAYPDLRALQAAHPGALARTAAAWSRVFTRPAS